MRSRRFPGTGSTASTKRILGLTHTPDCSKSKMRTHILSRVVHTGLAVFDKYLGDALYAMIVYAILRLLSRAVASAVCAMVVMTAIELFQLTMIPAHMHASEHVMTRICARLMGVEFSFLDLLLYSVGIRSLLRRRLFTTRPPHSKRSVVEKRLDPRLGVLIPVLSYSASAWVPTGSALVQVGPHSHAGERKAGSASRAPHIWRE